jgi:hypothetical protein
VWCADDINFIPSGVVNNLWYLPRFSNIICLSTSNILITIINSVKIKKGDKCPL